MDPSWHFFGSLVAHIGALAVASATLPPLGADLEEDVVDEQVHGTYMVFAHEADTEIEEPLAGMAQGSSRCCDHAMGDREAAIADGRYGVAGPADNPDPHIARDGEGVPYYFSMPGLNAQGSYGSADAPTSPWGRDDSLGTDPISKRGEMWGEKIAVARGAGGLGISEEAEAESPGGWGYRCRMP